MVHGHVSDIFFVKIDHESMVYFQNKTEKMWQLKYWPNIDQQIDFWFKKKPNAFITFFCKADRKHFDQNLKRLGQNLKHLGHNFGYFSHNIRH